MSTSDQHHGLQDVVTALASPESYEGLLDDSPEGQSLPSEEIMREVLSLIRSILFPGYYGRSSVQKHTLPYHIGVQLESLQGMLASQVLRAMCFSERQGGACWECSDRRRAEANNIAHRFITALPELRRLLSTDIEAAYSGDPAASSIGEVISCYPSVYAMTNYRVAHELHRLGVPLLPRMIAEQAHSHTGIDIHPAATIGEYFFIDHGTGVVIGATAIIGERVRLYQGVTLGARSFPSHEDGSLVRGIERHPIIEDDVIIYANATILGRIRIGQGARIGGNVWLTEDIPPGALYTQQGMR